MTKEDIEVWKSDREELLKTPAKFKKRVEKEISMAQEWQSRTACETCLFTDHCDGYEYSPICTNPVISNMPSLNEECEAYYNFLINKGWESIE